VCDALAEYPEDCRGVGLLNREAAKLQKFYVNAAPSMIHEPRGVTTRYR
jgi:hypothetical protein